MAGPPDLPRQVEAAAHALAMLDRQAVSLRAELAHLYRDLSQARKALTESHPVQLLEANEHLVLAALQAQGAADQAMSSLGDLSRASQHDTLTATPNRALVLDRLDQALLVARRRVTRVAVLFVDLDHFKAVNDTWGHAAGDDVIRQVARRLESAVRESDTVGRYGGDEFLVVLPAVTQASDAALIAGKMLAAVTGAPCQAGTQALHVSASVGIAVYPEDGEDAATLIDRADAAMYRAKRSGAGGFGFHTTADPGRPPLAVAGAPGAIEPAVPERRLRDLVESNERLLVAALAAHEQQEQGQDMLRRQASFLAMVAHELRNPLTPISTAAELLHRAHADKPLLLRLQFVIQRQVVQLSRLVEDLLDGSRVGTGKFHLECQALRMDEVFDRAVMACRPDIDARRQRLTAQWPPGPLLVHGDAVRLAQVFGNLLDNASKYTPQGGCIALTAVVRDETLVVTVTDNGIGISAQALPRLFDLFMQDPHALALHHHGLGIGLAVVRELVEAHGGTVAARSSGHGQGSEFEVTLPLVALPLPLVDTAAEHRG
jgi:diguanylate cyclase (GGDEF)-like protein